MKPRKADTIADLGAMLVKLTALVEAVHDYAMTPEEVAKQRGIKVETLPNYYATNKLPYRLIDGKRITLKSDFILYIKGVIPGGLIQESFIQKMLSKDF